MSAKHAAKQYVTAMESKQVCLFSKYCQFQPGDGELHQQQIIGPGLGHLCFSFIVTFRHFKQNTNKDLVTK